MPTRPHTDWRAVRDKIRDELDARNRQHEPAIYLMVGEREAFALAAGMVPRSVKAMARTAIDWEFGRPRRRTKRTRR